MVGIGPSQLALHSSIFCREEDELKDGEMMTGIRDGRTPFIRAGQRDRSSSMIGFAPERVPIISEVGVDKLSVTFVGHWHSRLGNGWPLFENALYLVEEEDWFNRPARSANPNTTSLRTTINKRRKSSTIKECAITARKLNQRNGDVLIDLTVNPTRTLAHLFARAESLLASSHAGHQDLLTILAALRPAQFFASAGEGVIEPSLDGSDNWLPPMRSLRQQLGSDFWPRYLGVFFEQIRRLCLSVLSEYPQVETIGTVDHLRMGASGGNAPDGVLTIDWSDVRIAEHECYFERFHSEAVLTVRRGGWALLAADHSAEMRVYSDPVTLNRDNGRFTIGLTLHGSYKLAIYAKRPDRIRFEVRRKGKRGHSDLPVPTTPGAQLLNIIQREREHLVSGVIWTNLGELLAGPDYPQLHDLARLIEQVSWAIADDQSAFAPVLQTLLVEGAITADASNKRVVQRLVRASVVQRVRLRPRDANKRDRRFALKAPYRDIHRLLADPLR